MTRKPFTLRQAVLTGAAVAAGSAAAALAEALHPGIGQIAGAATAIWVLDKLNTLIDDKG